MSVLPILSWSARTRYSHNQIQDFLVIWWKVKIVNKIGDAVDKKNRCLTVIEFEKENDNTEDDDLTVDIEKHVSKCVRGGSVDGNG